MFCLTVPPPAVPGCTRRSPGGTACWPLPSRSIVCSLSHYVPQTQSHTTSHPANTKRHYQSKLLLREWDFSNYESQFMPLSEVMMWRWGYETRSSANATAHRCQPISSAAPTGPIKVGPLEICVRGDSICHLPGKSAQSIMSCQTTKGAAILPALWIMKPLSCIRATVNDRLVNLVLRRPRFLPCHLSRERPASLRPSVRLSQKHESQQVIIACGCPIEMCRWDK